MTEFLTKEIVHAGTISHGKPNVKGNHVPTIDCHIDIPWQCYKQGSALDLEMDVPSVQVDFPRMKEGGLDKFVAALYLHDGTQDKLGPDKSWNAIMNQWHHLSHWPQIEFALEGGRLLNQSTERLEELAKLGIIYITLTHNRNTEWADSATDQLEHNGLTARGKSLVKRIQSLGILVDLSHSSDQTALDVLDKATVPVIASHSGVRNLVDHPRNLSDFLIREIAATGGIIGIPYASRFVINCDGVVLAIDYIAQLLGSTKHLAIGSDLDGADTVIKDVSEWSTVLDPLSDLGYSSDDIAGIKGGNFQALLSKMAGSTTNQVEVSNGRVKQ